MQSPQKTITDAIALSIVACVDTLAQRMTQAEVVGLRADTLNADWWLTYYTPIHADHGMLEIAVPDGPLAAFMPPGRVFFLANEAHAASVKAALMAALGHYWQSFDVDAADDADDDDADDASAVDVHPHFIRALLANEGIVAPEIVARLEADLDDAPPHIQSVLDLLHDAPVSIRAAWLYVLREMLDWTDQGDLVLALLDALDTDTDPARLAARKHLRLLDSGRTSHYASP